MFVRLLSLKWEKWQNRQKLQISHSDIIRTLRYCKSSALTTGHGASSFDQFFFFDCHKMDTTLQQRLNTSSGVNLIV